MGWLYLILAILFETFGTVFIKVSNGLTQFWPTIGMFVCYFVCLGFLSVALKTIPVGVAYAIWSAVGVIAISTIGILFFHESINLMKITGTVLIIAGVVTLRLSTP